MAVGFSTVNFNNKILDAIRGISAVLTTNTFVQLHTADPGAAGLTAVSVGSTTRVPITWAAASSNAITINGTLPVWTNGGTSETLTHISVHSLASGGSFLFSSLLTIPRAWVATDLYTLNSLTVTCGPVAA
jgi:hypothetical protein